MSQAASIESELATFRSQIDGIDDQIIALLKERIGIVNRVGALKHNAKPGECPIRPGREAEMVRRIVEEFKDSDFPPAAAASIWRTIIGASTSVEAPLTISAFTPDRDKDYYWLAREYFSVAAPITRQPQVRRVIGDVIDGKAAVGIIPMPHSADTASWWTNLLEQGDMPKIFARIPFVHAETPGRDFPSALAIARIMPEASGNDHSLLALQADPNVSQHRLQTAFATAKLDATWLNIATLNPASRHHLIEIKGFIMPDNEAIQSLLAGLGASIYTVHFLGAYAVPLTLKVTETRDIPHAAAPKA